MNALVGRTLQSGSAVGPWNSSNTESFICYTVRKNYSIAGWEFGKCMLPHYIYAKVASISVIDSIRQIINGDFKTHYLCHVAGFHIEFLTQTWQVFQVLFAKLKIACLPG